MVCSWSSVGSWPQARLSRGSRRLPRSLVLLVVQFLALTWPRAPTQEQSWPQGEEAKSRIQRLQPGHGAGNPGFQRTSQPASPQELLFWNQLNVFIYVAWSGAREGLQRDPTQVTAPTRMVLTYKTSEYKHPLLHPPPDPF